MSNWAWYFSMLFLLFSYLFVHLYFNLFIYLFINLFYLFISVDFLVNEMCFTTIYYSLCKPTFLINIGRWIRKKVLNFAYLKLAASTLHFVWLYFPSYRVGITESLIIERHCFTHHFEFIKWNRYCTYMIFLLIL